MHTAIDANYYFQYFLESIQTGWGLLALCMTPLAIIAMILVPKARWLAVSILLYVCTMGYQVSPWFTSSLIGPLEFFRANGRTFSFILLLLLFVPAILAKREWRSRLVSWTMLAFVFFELVYTLRVAVGGGIVAGLGGAVILSLTFICLGWGLSKWIQTETNAYSVVYSIAGAGILFVLCTVIQLSYNPAGIIWQDRLISTSDTSTHAAELIAVTLPAVCVVLLRNRRNRLAFAFWAVMAGCLAAFLVWTGTRTGAIMAIIALFVTFRRRLSFAVVVAVILLALGLTVSAVFDASGISAERMVSIQDTRSIGWAPAFGEFTESPLVGQAWPGAPVVESTYLTVAARAGLLGLVPMFFSMALIGVLLAKLQKIRGRLPDSFATLLDWTTGQTLALGAGAFLEGYMVGTFVIEVYVLYACLALMQFLFDAADVSDRGEMTQVETDYSHQAQPQLVGYEGY